MKDIERILNQTRDVVFIDFEGSQYTQEIIALGAVKCELDRKYHIKHEEKPFKIYIKINNPIGKFITNLTHITDDYLAEVGVSFTEAMKKLEAYIGKTKVKFISYGNFDIHLLNNSIKINNLNENPFLNYARQNFVDFSAIFSKYVKSAQNTNLSLLSALKVMQTNIEINFHDPLNDTINLMHLYEAFLTKKNIVKEEYIKVIRNSPKLPSPIRKALRKLETNNKVTYKDFLTYVDEDL